ncbi:unnamed protein product [Lepeophtheirus salmonis]|uniref:(salmon louse) hypothetical protein n=1 Tax=Lepeophtheirus salmonis TaxID=72036 RepID=A0A7R8H8N0_LEPSM|nr:unnamed protein product [Lepeophtheirus salmonis]CAF2944789.1 unnamed protein product [Lepeophtheirus salmonis]
MLMELLDDEKDVTLKKRHNSLDNLGTPRRMWFRPYTYVFSKFRHSYTDITVSVPLRHNLQSGQFEMAVVRRGHSWTSWIYEFNHYTSLMGSMTNEQNPSLILHCAGPEVQQLKKDLSKKEKENKDCNTALVSIVTDPFSAVKSIWGNDSD